MVQWELSKVVLLKESPSADPILTLIAQSNQSNGRRVTISLGANARLIMQSTLQIRRTVSDHRSCFQTSCVLHSLHDNEYIRHRKKSASV
jgi:hypothetical protein